jgi:hypothetical protein
MTFEDRLRQLSESVRNGEIEPECMSLDGEEIDCGRVGAETMAESRAR